MPRPKKPDDDMLREQLNIRLHPGEREKLHKLARANGLNLATWARIKLFEPRPMSTKT